MDSLIDGGFIEISNGKDQIHIDYQYHFFRRDNIPMCKIYKFGEIARAIKSFMRQGKNGNRNN